MTLKKCCLAIMVVSLLLVVNCGREAAVENNTLKIPEDLRSYVRSIAWDELGRNQAESSLEKLGDNAFRIHLVFDLENSMQQDDWQVRVEPAFDPGFHWSPHLTPAEENIIDQHAFRSPALIVASAGRMFALVPDLEIMQPGTSVRWYMDLDAVDNVLSLGMSESEAAPGLFFVRRPGAVYPAGRVSVGFYLFVSSTAEDLQNPWRRPLDFLWRRWGRILFTSGQPLPPDLEPYVEHTYSWAFRTWKDSVWQEFEWGGRRVGAPVFIVNVTQSPNYPGEVSEREFRSVWNQAWFSSLRSASGLFRFARRTVNRELREKALLTKDLALAAPRREGFFDTVIATEMQTLEIDGKPHRRSLGWKTAFWGNSDRNPVNRPSGQPRNPDIRLAPYHVLDMSWTALWMIRWYDELEKDGRLLDFARRYAESLLGIQDQDGYFPAWLEKATLRPLEILKQSPEAALSATFLFELEKLTGEARYREAALRAVDAVARDILPVGRWEDFETYWSSSSYGSGDLIGRKVARNNTYKQCNFSIFWTAEALYRAYKASGEKKYLEWGRRTLDELLMTQASWQPPHMYVPVLGGFGVMNADGEWLDARQSLFAEIILLYGIELGVEEYIQRGLAALRASFVMMYCPENPEVKILWEKKYPFFGPEDYGFTMENYGHGGATSPEGEGMGVFTIYDWGNGAAAEAWNRMRDHFGLDFLMRKR
jgi:hypothetical protein